MGLQHFYDERRTASTLQDMPRLQSAAFHALGNAAPLGVQFRDWVIGTRANEVASFGENLRQAREARNITLQEIAASTKISSRALQALEDEHFDQLPGGIFNKGFVRAYARCVGLDEEKTVAEYLAAAKVSPSEIDMEMLSTQVAAAAGARQPWAPNAATVVGVLAMIVALGHGRIMAERTPQGIRGTTARRHGGQCRLSRSRGTCGWRGGRAEPSAPERGQCRRVERESRCKQGRESGRGNRHGSERGVIRSPIHSVINPGRSLAETPEYDSGREAPAIAPATVASRTDVAHDAAHAAPVEVSISATARVWISVSSDGNKVETVTLDPEKPEARSRSYSAKEKLMLVVGNPAGLSVTYNGKPAGILGRSGERATITFTPEGSRTVGHNVFTAWNRGHEAARNRGFA